MPGRLRIESLRPVAYYLGSLRCCWWAGISTKLLPSV
uniref:Uncharacterized protein n=1 Tax=Arundo donax TaxID=35708 RepID=A0A0A9FC52_ARUDO